LLIGEEVEDSAVVPDPELTEVVDLRHCPLKSTSGRATAV
jgi:hypothetical protein